jgi:hypothetical protein
MIKSKANNNNLHGAKKVKNDEFYTQIHDIENEVNYYKQHFKDKVVYCNCDDPEHSKFFVFFRNKINDFDLKKLITTHYNKDSSSYKLEIDNTGKISKNDIKSNGDFRSSECIELLKESDIVVTNPPFSLFREYVDQLITYNKKFLIVGNMNAITYKEIFKLIKENKIWLGRGSLKEFKQPDGTFKKFGNVCWFTNLDHKKRNEILYLGKKYNSKDYLKYDNYNAIEVSKVIDIPEDYKGCMGVPITFLEKYNPEQFEIIKFRKGNDDKDLSVNGKCPYFRILIKNKHICKNFY